MERTCRELRALIALFQTAGFGDLVCSLVAVDYILKTYPWMNLLIWVPDYLLDFTQNVLPSNAVIRNYTNAKKKYDDTRPAISTQWSGRHTPMRVHPVDYAFHVMVDEHVDFSKKNYLKFNGANIDISRYNLPEKYVVIGVSSVFKVKEMPVDTTNAIAKYCVEKGYTPVFVGKEKDSVGDPKNTTKTAKITQGIDYSLGINLTNKTNLLELAKVIQGAKAYVGMDGGNVHIAGFTDTPIVVGYTFIDGKKHNVPIRNNILGYNCYVVEPDESLKCRFCQTKMNFVYDLWYPDCFYKDFECVKHMTPDKFINHLEKIL